MQIPTLPLNVVPDDYVRNKRLIDDIKVEIFRSELDEEGVYHLINLIEWRGDNEIVHTFDYSIDDPEEGDTTQETARCPAHLVDALPEEFQDAALAAVRQWQDAIDAAAGDQS